MTYQEENIVNIEEEIDNSNLCVNIDGFISGLEADIDVKITLNACALIFINKLMYKKKFSFSVLY